MTNVVSDSLANSQAAVINTTFSDGFLDFYEGPPGSSLLLASCKLPIAAFSVGTPGVLNLAGQWFGSTIASGTHNTTWARFHDTANTSFLDVTVSEAGGGGQIIVSSKTLHFGDVVSVVSFTYTIPLT